MAIHVRDRFNRSNSTTSLGTAETGQAWSNVIGANFGISSNKAYCHNPSMASFTSLAGLPKNVAVLDAGVADQDIRCALTTSPTSPNVGLVARYLDTANWLVVVIRNTTGVAVELLKFESGAFVSIHLDTTHSVIKNHTYQARLNLLGDTYAFSLDGDVILSGAFTSPVQAVFGAATKCGLTLFSGTFNGTDPNDPGDSRFDNFQVGAGGGIYVDGAVHF